MDVFKTLAAILHLGNVRITAAGGERSSVSVRGLLVSPSCVRRVVSRTSQDSPAFAFSHQALRATWGDQLNRKKKARVSMSYLQRVKLLLLLLPLATKEEGKMHFLCIFLLFHKFY